MKRFENKVALVTGGTTGIGMATAALFAEEGARVVITGQNQERLDEAARAIGNDCLAVRADARSLDETKTAMQTVKDKFGRIDALFVNAGITKPAPLEAVDEAHIDEQMGINFNGAFFAIQQAVPLMPEGGSIVVNTSCLNQLGMPGMSVYSASKAALRSLVRTLAAELIEKGIRVNAVSPGPVETPIYGKLGLPPEALQQMASGILEQVPMKRFGQAAEIAKAVLFLASTDASFVLGEELVVDGGWAEL